eukprot:TRINITY_DN87_c6_g1_i3.p1 TRINITY_DN87_c6_g1~~TRINITY_DN87_c6_g1_i3.p1  ORF type:complete len:396 (+),score=106.21 TRINITY_DN87_c6_g1_i3:120-1307(+)
MKGSERRINRIRDLMVQKICKMYKDQTGEKVNSKKMGFVNEKLQHVLVSRNPTDQDLMKILSELKHEYEGEKTSKRASSSILEPLNRKGSSVVGQLPLEDTQKKEESSSLEPTVSAPPTMPHPPSVLSGAMRNRIVQNDMWARLSKKDLQEYEIEESNRKKRTKDRMMAQKLALDEQVKQQQIRKAAERDAEERAHHEDELRAQQWRCEQEAEEARKRQAYNLEKQQRDQQLREIDKRKKLEQEEKRMEESAIASKIKQEIEAEQTAAVNKRLKAKEYITKFMEYNTEQRAAKNAAKEKEFELDKQLHRMYIDKLEKQERERDDSLKKLYARQNKQIAMSSKLAAGLAEKAADDERRAAAEHQKMLERVQNEEKRKQTQIASEKENKTIPRATNK